MGKKNQERIEAFNKEQIARTAKKVHAALSVVQGTAHTPEIEKLEADLSWILNEWLKGSGELGDSGYLYWAGCLIAVNENASPFPTFQCYVPATETLFLRDD